MHANYFNEIVERETGLDFEIPLSMTPENIICVSISGLRKSTSYDDILVNVCDYLNLFLKKLTQMYDVPQVFTQPILMYSPDKNEWTMKIGAMSKENFEKRNQEA